MNFPLPFFTFRFCGHFLFNKKEKIQFSNIQKNKIQSQQNQTSEYKIQKKKHQKPFTPTTKTKTKRKSINQNKENKATAKPTIKLITATSEDADFFFELVAPTFN